jgi:hypothetical protein
VLEVTPRAGEPDEQVSLDVYNAARFGYRPGIGRSYLVGPISGS